MAKKQQITETFNLHKKVDDCPNSLFVRATINAEYEYPGGWTWEVEKIHWVELTLSDKEGVDITSIVLKNPRMIARISEQVADMEEDIIEALANEKTAA